MEHVWVAVYALRLLGRVARLMGTAEQRVIDFMVIVLLWFTDCGRHGTVAKVCRAGTARAGESADVSASL